MKAAASVAIVLCAIANAQQTSADRTIAVTPSPVHDDFIVKLLRPLEPETYSPLTAKTRLGEYAFDTFGPYTIFREAAAAAVSQAMNSPHEWGGGTTAYAQRFASDMGMVIAHRAISYGLSAAFHEDNRYFASGKTTAAKRVLHAALSPFETRHDGGRVGFSYSNVAGVAGAALISRTWVPPSWQGGVNIGRAIGFTFAGEIGLNIFREFLPDILHHR